MYDYEYGQYREDSRQYPQDDIVETYEYQQNLVSEKKDESLFSIVRIINYFRHLYRISTPRILDIGCGPGTPTTSSNYLLENIADSYVTGVDSSGQMIETANTVLITRYGQRFAGFVSDFNSQYFWIPEINRRYDFITSFAALHYLSDRRMFPFMKEIYNHLDTNGVFIAGMGNRAASPAISEMENQFRIEYTYNQLEEGRRPSDFGSFKASFEDADSKANINWHSYREWLELLEDAGFREVDVVSHLWVRSIFLALK